MNKNIHPHLKLWSSPFPPYFIQLYDRCMKKVPFFNRLAIRLSKDMHENQFQFWSKSFFILKFGCYVFEWGRKRSIMKYSKLMIPPPLFQLEQFWFQRRVHFDLLQVWSLDFEGWNSEGGSEGEGADQKFYEYSNPANLFRYFSDFLSLFNCDWTLKLFWDYESEGGEVIKNLIKYSNLAILFCYIDWLFKPI